MCEITTASTSGSSSRLHGVGVYRLGPRNWTGLVLSEKTGSHSMRTPLEASPARVVSMRKLACPIQVTFMPSWSAPQVGFLIGTSSSRPGTGMNFGRSLPNLAFKALRPLRLLSSDEGQGFLKPLGGLPTWCAGGSGDLGTKDVIGSTEIIVARRLLNAMLLGRLVHEVYDRFGEADSLPQPV